MTSPTMLVVQHSAFPPSRLKIDRNQTHVSGHRSRLNSTSTSTSASTSRSSSSSGLRRTAAGKPPSVKPAEPTVSEASLSPPSAPSQPVVIPRRKGRSHGKSMEIPTRKASHGARPVHSPDSIPPAVSALLAVTSIPLPKSRVLTQQRRAQEVEKRQAAELMKALCLKEKEADALLGPSSKSPMDILLSPPDDGDDDEGSFDGSFLDTSNATDAALSVRSASSESMPSLSASSECSAPTSVSPITPTSRTRPLARKIRTLSSPPSEPCPLDHPLSSLPSSPTSSSPAISIPEFKVNRQSSPPAALPMPPPRRPSVSAFKSNLTHSLALLRAAARTIPTHPLSLLTTTLLTPDEPRPAQDSFSSSSSYTLQDNAQFSSSIQLSTYHRPDSPLDRSRTGSSVALGLRPRELRENPDFLRVVVLEMNMRRVGKLRKEGGRARLVLPARKHDRRRPSIRGRRERRWTAETPG
ncbi:MAG: hypothetical protein M1825_003231 [Sarcosagium campestre]|nr:MAG: hypothetical protein M1825_003231 [Sarcosagium campestre]